MRQHGPGGSRQQRGQQQESRGEDARAASKAHQNRPSVGIVLALDRYASGG
jgi:hypothetical protein